VVLVALLFVIDRAALGKPDPTAIAAMDSTLATELGITAPALQVMAGAALVTERLGNPVSASTRPIVTTMNLGSRTGGGLS
jgi:hypothetical protein